MVIKSYTSFEALKEDCEKKFIKVKEYSWNNLAVLTYNQFKSDSKDPLVQEARGLVIDKVTMEVVCRPFKKFENYTSENHAEAIKDKQYEFRAKMDGSLLKIFHYNGKWWFGTKGDIEAYGTNRYSGFSFISMVLLALDLKTIDELQLWCDKYLDKDSTHLFEIVSPYNKIVIDYIDTDLYYLGSIRTHDGMAYNLNRDILPKEVSYPAVYSKEQFQSANTLLDICRASNNTNIEGYVLYIDNVPMYKFKNALYVVRGLLNVFSDKLDEKLIARYLSTIVVLGEVDEWVSIYPQYKDQLIKMNDAFLRNIKVISNKITDAFIEYLDDKENESISYRKRLGLATKDCPIGSAIFSQLSDFDTFFSDISRDEYDTDEDFREAVYEWIEANIIDIIAHLSGKHQEVFISWEP